MRTRYDVARPFRIVAWPLLAMLLVALAPMPLHAAWTANGITVTPTTASIPKLDACSDGGNGSFVLWQEEASAGSGILRAQHVLESGDLDPSWPALGTVVCNVVIARPTLGVVPDRLGGFYAYWQENSAFYVSRIGPDGLTAAGWPARGRQIGTFSSLGTVPAFVEDGANGFYAAWLEYRNSPVTTDDYHVVGIHLGPSNTGAGGWPNASVVVSSIDPVGTLEKFPQLALAPDGGVFLAYACFSYFPGSVPSAFRLRRLTSAGANAAGWPANGIEARPFNMEPHPNHASLVALSEDGRGGVFLLTADGVRNDYVYPRLDRLTGNGSMAADWPAAGVSLEEAGEPGGPENGYRVMPDGLDGAFAGIFVDYTDSNARLFFRSVSPTGASQLHAGIVVTSHEAFSKGDGGMFLAEVDCEGKWSYFDEDAYLRVYQTQAPATWSNFSETHTEVTLRWFTDIGLAPIGSDGVVLYWAQMRERIGLFARRFTNQGLVTGVEPGIARGSLDRVRFVPGAGVSAAFRLGAGEPARLELFDVGGRRIASDRVIGGSSDHLVSGTAGLEAGLYWLRLVSPSISASGRVIVLR